jgi:beta-glucosidase-like glycosyl hydrolase
VNGVPTCLDGNAQNNVLRQGFGFDGLIVSDCDAIGDAWNGHSKVNRKAALITKKLQNEHLCI